MDREAPRTDGVLISGRDPKSLVAICLLVSCGALAMGVAMTLRRPGAPAMLMLAVGGGLAVGAAVLAFVLQRRRRFLWPTDDGFIYVTAQGERTFHDDDVMCVSLFSQQHYFWGNLQTVTRRFIIWVETASVPERIVCDSFLKPRATDPLQKFVVRIIDGLHRAAQDTYYRGERVEGDGWALERGQLLMKSARSTAVIPIAELIAVDIVDEQINIWRQAQDLPIGRISVRTANAHLLLLMLNDLLPERAEEHAANHRTGHLGRVIFERRLGSRSTEIIGWLIVTMLVLVTVATALNALVERRARRRLGMTITSVAFGSLAAAGATLLELKRRGRFRRHASGIYQRGVFTERRLHFREIANFSYAAIRRYSHGIYSGTLLTLNFIPAPGLNLRPIRFATNIHHADSELDRLRDEVSRVIADRMHEYWLGHGNCPWMPYVTFRSDALEYRPLTFTGRKPPILIAFSSIINFDIIDGSFQLWQAGQRKASISEETSQPNFYPGLMFLSKLLNRELATESAETDTTEGQE